MKYQHLQNKLNSLKGFTLIELMIVISIIAILSSIGLSSFITVQLRARDAQRKTDIQQIRIALEVYRSDLSTYPTTTILYAGGNCGNTLTSGGNTYIQKVPCDPKGGKYTYTTTGSTYTLTACLENSSDKDATNVASCSTGKGYVTTSP